MYANISIYMHFNLHIYTRIHVHMYLRLCIRVHIFYIQIVACFWFVETALPQHKTYIYCICIIAKKNAQLRNSQAAQQYNIRMYAYVFAFICICILKKPKIKGCLFLSVDDQAALQYRTCMCCLCIVTK